MPVPLMPVAWLLAVAWLLGSGSARAQSMDFALERLVVDASCRTADGAAVVDATGGVTRCEADDGAFKQLVNQFGMAIAPSGLYPARTVGYGGFEIALEGVYTGINSGADYMQRGTRGPVDAATGIAATRNENVPSILQLYSLRIRKGFGYGVETGLSFGYLTSTSIISGGLDLRWALLEGFRRGVAGYLPDVALTGSARTITGTSQLQLTVAAAGGVVSKPITIAQTGVLTPWLGYQYMWIFGDSGIIDLTPATDALELCGYRGPNQPGFSDGSGPEDGGPLCAPGASAEDANNSQVFEAARLERQRLLLGLSYKYEYLVVGAQAMVEPVSVSQSQDSPEDSVLFEQESTQFAFALQLGAEF